MTAKVPVFIDEQPEGGYTVTSPLFPEMITEGSTIEEVLRNIHEVFGMIIEEYVDEERPLPRGLFSEEPAVSLEPAVSVS
ncbi:MAG: type II toxin-antitoxin system HicB family antitoxin [Dehalococcoidia bacterium]|nr:type II toxin-antitoxin system HicB family antitoxin [Dehalococcoidia bacterium]